VGVNLSVGVVEGLREIARKHPEVIFLAITGSVARKGYSEHDVDVAVKLGVDSKPRKYDVLAALISEISSILCVPEESVDIIDLDRADPEVKAEVVKNSIVVIDKGYYRKLVNELGNTLNEYGEYRELSIREWLSSEDPTTIDLGLIKRRFDFIRSEVSFLKEYVLTKDVDEVRGSPVLSRVLERSYQLLIEALVDISRHIVSVMGWGPCFTASEYVSRLAQHNVIPRELADEVVKRVRLRNIIIHRYLDIDYEELYNDAQKLIGLTKEYEKYVAIFLRKHTQ